MTTLPSITIITPTLNQGNYIRETIDSVLDQEYPNLEYIIIDGGSTDETLSVLKEYGSKLSWVSEKDKGQSDAINKGLREASGDVIGYLNSDDLLKPGALLVVGECFSKNSNINWVTGKCKIVDSKGEEIRKAVTKYKNFWLSFNSLSILYVLNYISQPSTFIRRSFLNQVGEFNLELYYSMDYEYWLRAWRISRPVVIRSYLAKFRSYKDSKTGSGVDEQFAEELKVARKFSSSRVLLWLHLIHAKLAKFIYTKFSYQD